ncbi:MAG: GntR family transcriptional regulator [Synergistaceae bacterium]|nr:GntR family transcriptional regulator [Synergistaceae bacterium]
MNNFQGADIVPLYRRLYDHICRLIDDGEYMPGDKIQSEEELCAEHGVSRVTVRNAIQRLVNDGVLVKSHGRGTFVAVPAFIESMDAKGSFTESCLKINAVPSTRVISLNTVIPRKEIAERLLSGDSGVICLKRLRLIDGVAVIFEDDYFRMEYESLFDGNIDDVSLFSLIQRKTGIAPRKFEGYFDISMASHEHASYLECPEGYPLLRVRQTIKAEDMRVIYFNEQFIRADRYKYAVSSS